MSSVSKKFEGINLIDTKDGDGIEAWVTLKENDMRNTPAFCPSPPKQHFIPRRNKISSLLPQLFEINLNASF